MKLTSIKSSVTRLLKNLYVQAVLVGTLLVAPFITYTLLSNTIIAPLNIVSGWDVSSSSGSVIAEVPSDVVQQMLPFRQYTKDSLEQYHEIPLWNMKSFAGDVFLSNPINMALFPLNFLLHFIDIYTFQNILVLFGMFLMGSSMYLLLRQYSRSIVASILGATAYTYAPFTVFWSLYGIVSIPMAAIPLSLYFYERWKKNPHPFNIFLPLIIASLGFTAFMGHIQIAILSYIILFAMVCFDLLRKKLPPRRLVYICVGFVVALMIGAAQIIPMAHQTPLSHRSQETTVAGAKPWDKRLDELARITTAYDLSRGPVTLGQSTRSELSVGQVPGVLMVISIIVLLYEVLRRKKITQPLFFTLLFVFGAFWQWNDFPQPLLNMISPVFKSLATDYFLPIALLSMAILSSFGLDWLIKRIFKNSQKQDKLSIKNLPYLLPISLIALFSIPQFILNQPHILSDRYYFIYTLIIVITFIFYVSKRHLKISSLLFSVTIVLIALLQGWALYRATQPMVKRDILTIKSQELNYIRSREDDTVTIVDYGNPQESLLYDVSLINGYDSLYSSSIQKRIQAINLPNSTPSTYRNNALVINTTEKPTLFKNLGVKYTLNKQPVSGYPQVYPGVFAADQPTPKVYFAKKITYQSREEQLNTLSSGVMDYHETFIDGVHKTADMSSSISYTQTSNSLTIQTSSDGGLAFIAQTYNKDWVATLEDGTRLELLPANYDFSAIDIPKGQHTITLRYTPLAVTIGFAVSSVAIIVILGSVVFILYREYRTTNSRK